MQNPDWSEIKVNGHGPRRPLGRKPVPVVVYPQATVEGVRWVAVRRGEGFPGQTEESLVRACLQEFTPKNLATIRFTAQEAHRVSRTGLLWDVRRYDGELLVFFGTVREIDPLQLLAEIEL